MSSILTGLLGLVSKPQNATALRDLDFKVFESAALSAQPVTEGLKKKLGADSDEFKLKFMPVLFEFLYFYLHLANRSAFAQLGATKSRKLSHELVKLSIKTTIETQMGHWPETVKDGIKNESFHNYNMAEANYAHCNVLWSMPEAPAADNVTITTGKNDESVVGQLINNVSEIIVGKGNVDGALQFRIFASVADALKKNKKDIDALIPKASAALK
jgi:hypothetical protein